MKLHREGFPLLVLASLLWGLLWAVTTQHVQCNIFRLGGGTVLGCLALFFRVPKQHSSDAPHTVIVAPASGTVVAVDNLFESEYLLKETIRVSIFLSIFNVHMNAAPISGIIRYRAYHPGGHIPAFRSGASLSNEHSTLVIETTSGASILVRQIAGILARRISTYPVVESNVTRSEEIGFIKFGSRVDVFLPADAQILVQIGDRVCVGVTAIADIRAILLDGVQAND